MRGGTLVQISNDQSPAESLESAVALLTGRTMGASLFSRRRALEGLLAGAAGLVLPATGWGQVEIPPGQIRLMFNENPYGPSPKALAEVAKILPMTAYYPGAIEDDLMGFLWPATNSIVSRCFWRPGRTRVFRPR